MNSATKKRKIDPEAKHTAILNAAMELFSSQGYAATSIAAIAGKADVAVGTVHRIFTDKANVLAAAKTQIEKRLTSTMVLAWQKPGPLETRFQTMLNAIFDEMIIIHRFMPIMALKVETHGSVEDGHYVRLAIKDFIRAEISAGNFRQMPIDHAAEIMFGMVDGATRNAASGNIHEARLVYVPLLAGMMMRAVAA